MLKILFLLIGRLLSALYSWSWWFGVVAHWYGLVIAMPTKSPKRLIFKINLITQPKLIDYYERLKRSKPKILSYKKKSKKLILYGLSWAVLLLTFPNFTAFCQTDTISETRKDSLVFWLPFIVKDLQDYDLIKQKSYYQDQQIKGLQAITNAQKNVSIRQNIRLETYSSSMVQLQSNNQKLQIDLKSTRKKLLKSRITNFAFIVLTPFLIYCSIKYI